MRKNKLQKKHIHSIDTEELTIEAIDPILRMYNAAMSAATARLEIIKDEFYYRGLRCPIHHIDTRLKSAGSILGKLEKKQLVPVELQIRTLAMDLWASLEHDIRYKTIQTVDGVDVDFSQELLECSELIYQAEEKMTAMNTVLES